MLSRLMSAEAAMEEIKRIDAFIQSQIVDGERVVLGVSGGLDSDVVARLAVRNLPRERVKLFVVLQEDMEDRHLTNARDLAAELGIRLVEIDLADLPKTFVRRLAQADPAERFRPAGLLDPSRAKCSIRTVVLSSYQDRGFVIVGTSNRTELDLGFFLPLGDGLCHVAPIAHLYKSEVRLLARNLGTARVVLEQPASAGFWPEQDDLEDLSYWLYCRQPIGQERDFDEEDIRQVEEIRSALSTRALDLALAALAADDRDESVAAAADLPAGLIQRLRQLVEAARTTKHRPLGICLEAARHGSQPPAKEGGRAC